MIDEEIKGDLIVEKEGDELTDDEMIEAEVKERGLVGAVGGNKIQKEIFGGLNLRQSFFVREFWNCAGNATEAYMKAYKLKNYASAANSASDLLKKAEIQNAIKNYNALQVNETFVINRLRELGSSSEKESDQIKAISKLSDILGMSNAKNANAGKGSGVAIQINVGLPDKGNGRIIDV